MIQYLLTKGHFYVLKKVMENPEAPKIKLLTYDQLIWSRCLPRATYIFTDMDRLAYSDLELAARLYRRLKEAGMRVLNDPARVKKRFGLLRALHQAGFNDYRVHHADELPEDIRFPVFVRRRHGHGQPCTGLLDNRAALEAALDRECQAGVALDSLMVIEYAGEEIRPGLFRKLSIFRMGDQMIPSICVHQADWLVKQGTMGVAGEELYQDELRMVRENPFAEQLRPAFELAGIEYGRADFGFYKGRLQVFEINTNPHIPHPAKHAFATRVKSMEENWQKVIAGFRSLDSPPGPGIVLPKETSFRAHRKWSRLFMRTRLVE